jgi:hypothetical protein
VRKLLSLLIAAVAGCPVQNMPAFGKRFASMR